MTSKEKITQLRKLGFSERAIGNELGCSHSQVHKILRGTADGHNLDLSRNLHHDAFTSQTPNADFWAGFLAADGYINEQHNRISIALQAKDENFIGDFAEWCGSGHKLARWENAVALRFTSEAIVRDLRLYYNVGNAKSMTLIPPKRQSLYFVAGYWAGDGGIWFSGRRREVYFTGTKKVMTWIRSYFADLSAANVYPNQMIWQLRYSGYNVVLPILERIWKHSPYKLARKYNCYKQMLGVTSNAQPK